MENKTNYSISLSVRANRELQESFSWYEDQQVGLGSRFIQEAISLIRTIRQNPELFSLKTKFYGEVSMRTFPFLVVYRINKGNMPFGSFLFSIPAKSQNKIQASQIDILHFNGAIATAAS